MSKNSRCYNCKELLVYKKGKCGKCGVKVTSNGNPLPLCPVCEKSFSRRAKGGFCPKCGAKLKLVRKKVRQMNVLTYQAVNPPKEKPTIKKEEYYLKTPALEVKQLADREWHMLFKALPERGVCPNCGRVLFKNARFLHGSQDLKCDRCKHFITTEFRVFDRMRV